MNQTAHDSTAAGEGRETSIEAITGPAIAAVETFLDAWLGGLDEPANLLDAVRYALLGGGKRLRPVLCWHAAAAAGLGDHHLARCVPAAASVELVHAFSLVHDDLPAMDDDDMRRGRPTLHIHAGEAMAILAGDAMLAMAFSVLDATPPAGGAFGASLRGRLTTEIAAGTMGMIGGQVYDTLGGFPEGLTEAERVELTHRNKTGALLRAACRMGAFVATDGHDADSIACVSAYADAIGLMYQIVDDLIDVEQPSEHTGKRTNKDAGAGKITYPSVVGIEASRRWIDELESDANDALGPLGERAAPLRGLVRYLAKRSR